MADPLAGALTLLPPGLALIAAAAAVALLPRRAGAALGAATAAAVVGWLAAVPAGVHLRVGLFGFETVPFAVDPLSRTVGLVLAFVAVPATAYGYGTGASRRGLALSLAYLGAGLVAVFAGDWLTLVLAWEALAVAATALVWTTGDAAARRAGLRYAVYHEAGGLALLGAVLLRYVETGTLLFGGLGGGTAAGAPGAVVGVAGFGGGLATALAVAGIGLNVGFVGLHPWLVDTYPRPHPATSVVLAACTTKVGVYALARAVPDGGLLVAYLGGAMLLVGVTYAVLQTDTRRLLSYHIVSQVGFMVAGVGIGSPLGVAGAVAHLVNNVLYKSLLFAVAGALLVRTGESSLKRLGGLARSMPATFTAFAVAAAAIAGVPGLNGFVSKAMVIDAAEDAGLDALWWALVVGSVGTAVSFLKFGYYAFVRDRRAGRARAGADGTTDDAVADTTDDTVADTTADGTDDPGPAVVAAFAVLAAPCVVLGVAPGLLFAVLPGSAAAAKPFAASQFLKAGAILAAGAVAFAALRGPLSRAHGAPDLDSVYHPAGARLLRALTGAVGGTGRRVDDAVRSGTAAAVALASVADDAGSAAPGRVVAGRFGDDGVGWSVLLVVATLVLLLAVLFV